MYDYLRVRTGIYGSCGVSDIALDLSSWKSGSASDRVSLKCRENVSDRSARRRGVNGGKREIRRSKARHEGRREGEPNGKDEYFGKEDSPIFIVLCHTHSITVQPLAVTQSAVPTRVALARSLSL